MDGPHHGGLLDVGEAVEEGKALLQDMAGVGELPLDWLVLGWLWSLHKPVMVSLRRQSSRGDRRVAKPISLAPRVRWLLIEGSEGGELPTKQC